MTASASATGDDNDVSSRGSGSPVQGNKVCSADPHSISARDTYSVNCISAGVEMNPGALAA